MSYQTFETRGSSDSPAKWKALALPASFVQGKRALDLGCNEGYFCLKLCELGADRVTGVDNAPRWLERATARLVTPAHKATITYELEDWKDLPGSHPAESYDLVLLLSAFHYAASPQWFDGAGDNTLLKTVARLLTSAGVLVLECGVVAGETPQWVRVPRARDTVYHPTRSMLLQELGKFFGRIEEVGPSVAQAGDPIPRRVFYCYKS